MLNLLLILFLADYSLHSPSEPIHHISLTRRQPYAKDTACDNFRFACAQPAFGKMEIQRTPVVLFNIHSLITSFGLVAPSCGRHIKLDIFFFLGGFEKCIDFGVEMRPATHHELYAAVLHHCDEPGRGIQPVEKEYALVKKIPRKRAYQVPGCRGFVC